MPYDVKNKKHVVPLKVREDVAAYLNDCEDFDSNRSNACKDMPEHLKRKTFTDGTFTLNVGSSYGVSCKTIAKRLGLRYTQSEDTILPTVTAEKHACVLDGATSEIVMSSILGATQTDFFITTNPLTSKALQDAFNSKWLADAPATERPPLKMTTKRIAALPITFKDVLANDIEVVADRGLSLSTQRTPTHRENYFMALANSDDLEAIKPYAGDTSSKTTRRNAMKALNQNKLTKGIVTVLTKTIINYYLIELNIITTNTVLPALAGYDESGALTYVSLLAINKKRNTSKP